MRRHGRTSSLWVAALLSGVTGALCAAASLATAGASAATGVAGALGATAATALSATNPCTGFRWNVDHERALFETAAQSAVAGRDSASAPVIRADRLYDLSLAPQQSVHFVLQPEKRALTDGAYAGIARLRVAAAGPYRISIDRAFWIDVIANDQIIESRDFAGRPGCGAPHKIVVYELPAGTLVLQLSGAISPKVRVTLTRVPAGTPVAAPRSSP